MNSSKLLRWKVHIIKVGRYSAYVRIPHDWIKTNELIPVDSVEIFLQADGSLCVVPCKQGVDSDE